MPCTTILVGKNASADGSVIIARNDDGGFEAKKIVVMPSDPVPRVYKSVIAHREIALPGDALRYTAAPNVNKKDGIWAASGINEKNVAMTATETITSNPRVLGADPFVAYKKKQTRGEKDVPGGIGEEDLVTLVLPFIRSAREGVLRLGSLLEEHGTYESNGIAFADKDEIWWLETIGGHHWIARRVPDDRVVIMPNQFGLDDFDFEDALSGGKENLCSADLKRFMEENRLNTGRGTRFDPRLAFGSRTDADHIYNTPRAWYMARYFLPRSFRWDGENADYTPESDDIPWSFVPERLVTVEDVKYLLSSHYQGTRYDPYDKASPDRTRYRVIGVPNSDISAILQIRGDKPEALQGIEWLSMGGSGFTACFPLYTAVSKLPDYISGTGETVSTAHMYWTSRIIAALTDADYADALIHDERYVEKVFNETRRLLNEYDAKYADSPSEAVLEEANTKIAEEVRKASEKALDNILREASTHMKTKYRRGDH